jgi:hypothetical protein
VYRSGVLFRRKFRSPFELVVARLPDPVLRKAVGPSRPAVTVGGAEYELHEDPRVAVPELLVEDYFTYARAVPPAPRRPDPPEVALREAVRACLSGGVPTDRISEIVKLEVVDFVMES